MKDIKVKVPDLHPGQQVLDDSARRYNVAAMGRRFGKTKYGIQRLLCGEKSLMQGYSAGWFAPSSRYIDEVWAEVVYRCKDIISNTNKQSGRITFVTGASLDFWPMGENPQVARGRRYARVIIDEAAHIRYLQEAWERAVSPTLTDYKGEAWFISTPNGLNFFHELWERGQSEDYLDWQSWQLPTVTNPHIDPLEVEGKRGELPNLVFTQEYEAQFVTFGGGLVKPEMLRYGTAPAHLPCAMGVDLAISEKAGADYTAIAVLAVDQSTGFIYVKAVVRERLSFHQAQQEIIRLADQYKPATILIEAVQYQSAVVQELLRTTSLPVRGIKPDRDKITRFQPLLTRYEQNMVFHDNHNVPPWFRDELLSFPEAPHDDGVDALVYAYLSANTGGTLPTLSGARIF